MSYTTPTKRYIITLATTVALCFTPAILSAQTGTGQGAQHDIPQDKLLPEVAQILLHRKAPTTEALKQDVYAGLIALHEPEGADYMSIGAQIITCQFNSYQKTIAAQNDTIFEACPNMEYIYKPSLKIDLKVQGEDLHFPCKTLNAQNCVEQTLARKDDYVSLIQKNAVLLERYAATMQLPNYHSYFFDIKGGMPPFHYMVRLSELRLVQAVIAFHQEDTDTGFKLLTEEIQFAKRSLTHNTTLIGKMIALAQLYTSYHTLSTLLDSPFMQPYLQDKRLLTLLALPNQDEQTAIAHLENEQNYTLYFSYTLSLEALDMYIDPPIQVEGIYDEIFSQAYHKELAASGMTPKQFLHTHYNRYATTNMTYAYWQTISNRMALNFEELAAIYDHNDHKLPDLPPPVLPKKNLTDSNSIKQLSDNFIGEGLLTREINPWDEYSKRFYDSQVYIHLVNFKHQIISAKLKANEVNAFIQKAGQAAQHPITREPFTWDESTLTLSTPWIAGNLPVGGRGNGIYPTMESMSVYIPLPN